MIDMPHNVCQILCSLFSIRIYWNNTDLRCSLKFGLHKPETMENNSLKVAKSETKQIKAKWIKVYEKAKKILLVIMNIFESKWKISAKSRVK